MFLLHLIGDLHQPLHATGYKKGGNELEPLCWKKKPPASGCNTGDLNLHSIYDSRILHTLRGLPNSLDNEEEKAAAAEFADDLFKSQNQAGIGPEDECSDIGGDACVLEWTVESNALVCSHVLARGERWIETHDLSKEYYEENKGMVENQIGKAGLRLAAWLNAIAEGIPVSEDHPKPEAFEEEQRFVAGDLWRDL